MCGVDATFTCSACQSGRDPGVYCSKACPSHNWAIHKVLCKQNTKDLEYNEIVAALHQINCNLDKYTVYFWTADKTEDMLFYVSLAVLNIAGIYIF